MTEDPAGTISIANLPSCGTYAGYAGHHRLGEQPCDHCKAAAVAYMREYRNRRGLAADRWRNRTREWAMLQLSREYSDRFEQILEEVRTANPPPEDGLRGRGKAGLVPIGEAAELIGRHHSTIRRYIQRGRITGHKVADSWYVDVSELANVR